MLEKLRAWFSFRASKAAPPTIVPASQLATPRQASEAFTPTQPRTNLAMLVGRQDEIRTIVQGLMEDKAHIVLYAERGRGKTSLANIIVEALRRHGVIVARYQCEAGTTFDTLVRGLMRNLPKTLLAAPGASELSEGCEAALPLGPVRPEDVAGVLPRLRLRALICVIDEFDRVAQVDARTMLADTIKQVSDGGIPLLFMVIGVSDNLEQLIGQHPSIQRNLVAVPLPLLSDDDILTLVEKAAKQAALTFPRELAAEVAFFSHGIPYVAHLLGLRAVQAAARQGSSVISASHLMSAVTRLVAETPLHVLQRYDEITAGDTDAAVATALRDIVTCAQDRWGHMALTERPGEDVVIGGARIEWACWLQLRAAGVLRPCAGKRGYMMFADPALAQYVLFKAADQATWPRPTQQPPRPAGLGERNPGRRRLNRPGALRPAPAYR